MQVLHRAVQVCTVGVYRGLLTTTPGVYRGLLTMTHGVNRVVLTITQHKYMLPPKKEIRIRTYKYMSTATMYTSRKYNQSPTMHFEC